MTEARDGQDLAELFEQGDEAFDQGILADPTFLEAVENDPSLDPANQVDDLELEEVGAQLDDPAMFEGTGSPGGAPRANVGWELDASITGAHTVHGDEQQDASDALMDPSEDHAP